MAGNPFNEDFLNTVDAVLTTSASPSATLRVADLHYGTRSLGWAIEEDGTEVVYTQDGKAGLPDFQNIPTFDLVVVNMPRDPDELADALEFALRFLRVRQPAAFILVGLAEGTEFPQPVADELARRSYRTSVEDGSAFVGTLDGPSTPEVRVVVGRLARSIYARMRRGLGE